MATLDKSENNYIYNTNGFLTGKLLVAMPSITDGRFHKSVIYICSHDESGAMGIVINQPIVAVDFKQVADQLNLKTEDLKENPTIFLGGPISHNRGFVIHSKDYQKLNTIITGEDVGVTGTTDIIKEIAKGKGPLKSLFALGCASWEPGQLELEVQGNSWMIVSSDDSLLFDTNFEDKWKKSFEKLGIKTDSLSYTQGSA